MICQEIEVDHGLQVPMELFWGRPAEWPVKVVPIFVNVIQYPIPLPSRCYEMGRILRKAIESYDSDERFVVLGTGGLSHQLRARGPASSIRPPIEPSCATSPRTPTSSPPCRVRNMSRCSVARAPS